MQHEIIPELDSNTVDLNSIEYKGQAIHVFQYDGKTWYFVGELIKAFGVYTFKHHAERLQGERMYVRINNDVTQARIIFKAVHINTLRVMGQGIDKVSTEYRHDVQKVSGRMERIVISEIGVANVLKNSPYREQILQRLGIDATKETSKELLQTPLASPNMIRRTINMTTEVGIISLNLTLNDKESDRTKAILENIKEIISQMN